MCPGLRTIVRPVRTGAEVLGTEEAVTELGLLVRVGTAEVWCDVVAAADERAALLVALVAGWAALVVAGSLAGRGAWLQAASSTLAKPTATTWARLARMNPRLPDRRVRLIQARR